MPASVESMFYVREVPWHGLGINVAHTLNSEEALVYAGLDWQVIQKQLQTDDDILVENLVANVRETDNSILGVVSKKYKILQNFDAFRFTDDLLGGDIQYETAGSLCNGKRVWMLATLSKKYDFLGDDVTPYMVLFNSHDGSTPVRVAMTPVRVVCQNTLNLALKTAKRSWSVRHTSNIHDHINKARETLGFATQYMNMLQKEMESFHKIKINDNNLKNFIEFLVPKNKDNSDLKNKNIDIVRNDIYYRFYNAPDLVNLDKTGYRFLNAISDHETHFKPFKKTDSYQENLFIKTVEKPKLLDVSFELLKEAV